MPGRPLVAGVWACTTMIGIVIGSYGMPSTVALNIAAIKHFNNQHVPILVHDDCTPATLPFPPFPSDVDFYRTPSPLGHIGGDLSAFITGLEWAKSLNLKYLLKLSQRFIFTQTEWVARSLNQADAERAITMGQPPAFGGKSPWPRAAAIRSECVLMRVDAWAREEVYLALRVYPHTPEMSIRGIAETMVHPGRSMGRWRQFGPDKAQRRVGVLWHDADPEEAYHQLAQSLGVSLEGYHNAGWRVALGHDYKM
jgi:hypothetical protein